MIINFSNLGGQGGGTGDANVRKVTQEEYDALTTIDPKAIYVITDAEEIDLDAYALKDEVQPLLEELDENKVNKQNVTEHSVMPNYYSNDVRLPLWNKDGIIVGVDTNLKMGAPFSKFNGANFCFVTKDAASITFFAPTVVGTKGQVLVSNGSGAPVWETSIKSAQITQDAYDALVDAGTTDANTLYLIVEE